MEIVRDSNGGTHVDSSSSIIITETEISSDQGKLAPFKGCPQLQLFYDLGVIKY